MPIMGYKVETADLSDKVLINIHIYTFSISAVLFSNFLFLFFINSDSQATHPYFGRVSFSAGARFEAEAAFLQSHYWDKVVSQTSTW